jgi:SAM-dependent methyltransferase
MRGIGFAVGQEPLTSIFASCGANVLASDIATGDVADEWSRTGQHASSLEALHKPGLVSREDFDKRVSFEPVNMTDLSSIASGQFDFAWSACSLEHLGSLAAGLEFIKNTVRLLKPGGISVHTTEYNVSSNEETIETGETVIFREQDLRRLEGELRDMNACLARLDLFEGLHRHDIEADYLPYHENGRQHIKLRIGQFTATSVLLIVQN